MSGCYDFVNTKFDGLDSEAELACVGAAVDLVRPSSVRVQEADLVEAGFPQFARDDGLGFVLRSCEGKHRSGMAVHSHRDLLRKGLGDRNGFPDDSKPVTVRAKEM